MASEHKPQILTECSRQMLFPQRVQTNLVFLSFERGQSIHLLLVGGPRNDTRNGRLISKISPISTWR